MGGGEGDSNLVTIFSEENNVQDHTGRMMSGWGGWV